MSFIKSTTHGFINPAHVRRIVPGGDEKNLTLTLHVQGEGELTVTGEEALDVARQLEAMYEKETPAGTE